MHQQAQLRLKKAVIEELGAAAFVVLSTDPYRAEVFKKKNLLLSTFDGPFKDEKELVFATALCDPAGRAAAIYGVSRRCMRWGAWAENRPCWFVINGEGILTYEAQPTFATPTSYVKEVDQMLEALRKAARPAPPKPSE